MSNIFDNSIWPNAGGTLGQNKVQIPDGVTTNWPEGDALVGNFVFDKGNLVGFVDTKALIVNDTKTTTFPYDYVNISIPSIAEGEMNVEGGAKPEYLIVTFGTGNSGSESFDFVIIEFNTTDTETINTVRTAKRVVDNKLYDADDNLIGTIDTSKIEAGGFSDEGAMKADGLFCNKDLMTMGDRGLILSEFDSDLSSLTDGILMFTICTKLTTFTSDLSSLTNAYSMFNYCSNLNSFNCDNLSSLTDGEQMFNNCGSLTSFSADLSNLTNGEWMFGNCKVLNSFHSNLSSLTNGEYMLYQCPLDTASVQNIADTINTYNGIIHIGIANSTPNEQEIAAFNTIVSKGWTVYVDNSQYTATSTAITALDENGEETVAPIPYWAKPVPSDEKHARYIDSEGNYYNILGAQFIYGDNLETYGMFTCEEDAAANMRLTKIEKDSPKNL